MPSSARLPGIYHMHCTQIVDSNTTSHLRQDDHTIMRSCQRKC